MSHPQTVGEAYDKWWTKVSPPNCHRIQREEMRRSFYSGAYSMYLLMIESAALPEKEALRKMQDWHVEFQAFLATIKHMKMPSESSTPPSSGVDDEA